MQAGHFVFFCGCEYEGAHLGFGFPYFYGVVYRPGYAWEARESFYDAGLGMAGGYLHTWESGDYMAVLVIVAKFVEARCLVVMPAVLKVVVIPTLLGFTALERQSPGVRPGRCPRRARDAPRPDALLSLRDGAGRGPAGVEQRAGA